MAGDHQGANTAELEEHATRLNHMVSALQPHAQAQQLLQSAHQPCGKPMPGCGSLLAALDRVGRVQVEFGATVEQGTRAYSGIATATAADYAQTEQNSAARLAQVGELQGKLEDELVSTEDQTSSGYNNWVGADHGG